jgi:hypothetical protein
MSTTNPLADNSPAIRKITSSCCALARAIARRSKS